MTLISAHWNYGWWVTLAFAVMVFLSTGVRFFELTGGYAVAFTIASVQLPIAAALSLTIDERARCLPRLRPVTSDP